MVKLLKNGVEQTFASLNDACLKNGATYGRNTANAISFLSSAGFDMSQFTPKASTPKVKATSKVIAILIDSLSVVDTAKVDQLKTELNAVMFSGGVVTDKTIKRANQLKTEIEQASKPTEPTLDAIIERVKTLYAEHIKTEPTK
jgi:hypothetical protein